VANGIALLSRLGISKSDPKWIALGLLYKRPWFQRVWVIQEVVLSRGDVSIFCGSKMIYLNSCMWIQHYLLKLDIYFLLRAGQPYNSNLRLAMAYPAIEFLGAALAITARRKNLDLICQTLFSSRLASWLLILKIIFMHSTESCRSWIPHTAIPTMKTPSTKFILA